MKVFMGGTFDPVHCGHLQIATEVAESLGGIEVSLMPCYQPVHKDVVHTESEHRLAMLEVAVNGNALLSIDRRELDRSEPSFTIDTLRELRALDEQEPIVMLIGGDSLKTLGKWRSSSEFAKLCHVIVLQRPGHELSAIESEEISTSLGFSLATVPQALAASLSGSCLFMTPSLLEISSSLIRERVRKKYTISYLVPSAVSEYIWNNSLYQL